MTWWIVIELGRNKEGIFQYECYPLTEFRSVEDALNAYKTAFSNHGSKAHLVEEVPIITEVKVSLYK